ncbi:MAG: UDP-N-acetylglucosamine--N-acetylmuramyl-(pentapeptide) pyrophosphoryl-undecaprenol N-acetylglucosamine transferase [Chitinophagaceae bacterium]
MAANLDQLVAQGIQLIWQTGKLFFETASAMASSLPMIRVFDFVDKMEFAYAAADLVISRAGALAIAELCVAKKAVIFVPYPFAADDHQTSNAMALVKRDAAVMVRDADIKKELIKKVLWLLREDKRQEILVSNIAEMALPDADQRIAQEIFKIMV